MSVVEKISFGEVNRESLPVAVETIKQSYCSVRQNARLKSVFRKGRSDVSGSGAKPYKQKGTGRSRCGSTRSSIRVGGAAPHGARRVRTSQRVNKKVRKQLNRWFLSVSPTYRLTVKFKEFKSFRNEVVKAIKVIREECADVVVCVSNVECHEFKSIRNLSDIRIVFSKSLGIADLVHSGLGLLFLGESEEEVRSRVVQD